MYQDWYKKYERIINKSKENNNMINIDEASEIFAKYVSKNYIKKEKVHELLECSYIEKDKICDIIKRYSIVRKNGKITLESEYYYDVIREILELVNFSNIKKIKLI